MNNKQLLAMGVGLALICLTGLFPPLGGDKYGPLVAKTMELYAASTVDHALRDFVDQVCSWLRQH